MKNTVSKKGLALFLSFLLILKVLPVSVLSSAADTLPVMEAYNAASSGDYHKYYNKVVTVTFLDWIDKSQLSAADAVASWDVSEAKDESVMAWMKLNAAETQSAGADRYDVYIGGEGGISANPDSSYIFYCFSMLKEISGLENFKTDKVTTFNRMFEKCSSLAKADLSSFNTSNVKTMDYMFCDCSSITEINFSGWNTENVTSICYVFMNCKILPELDISSFDTKNVTNMEHLFYNCHELAKIYVGSGWNIDNVIRGGSVFNCCYALMGGIENYDSAKTDVSFATVGDPGFLTPESEKPQPEIRKYTVTYLYTGNVPEGVTVPASFTADENTWVILEANPVADGYEFSGWSSEDVHISNGEFTLTNDVTITGSWSKLYNVYYKYTGEVPEDAPALNSYAFKEGDIVSVDGLPFATGYVFIGWTTDDVEVNNGKFSMPDKDVTLYGSFKKPVQSVEINGGDITVNVDDEVTINVTVKPDDATVKDIIYESSDENIITVDNTGKITAVGEGTAIITVSSVDNPDIKDTVTVTVKVPVTVIEADKNDITLNKGESDKITVTVNEDATNKEVEFTSDDEKVIKVDKDGNITAVGEGTATITVTSKDDPTKKDEITVTVKIPVTEVNATDDFTLNVGDEKNVDASVNDDATNKELVYESSDPEVAKVDKDGNVTAVGEGTATITVTSKDDPLKKTEVKVTVKIPVTDITADEKEITLNKGESDKITVTVIPENATDKEVNFSSSDETVVTVDKNGNITAVGEGTATITVTSKDDPLKKTEVKVTVKIPVTDITADEKEITLNKGESDRITVTVIPENATDKEVNFSSSDETVVTVDKNGNITAVGEGTATITVTSKEDPLKKAEVKVTVKIPVIYVPVTEITSSDEITLTIGEKENVDAWVNEDATNKELIYVSSDESVAKVDKNGNVTAVGEGEAIITITSADNSDIKKTVEITVTKPEYSIAAPENITVYINATKNLGVKVTPSEGAPELTYVSSDESIVKVSADGNITGVGAGTANITVDMGNGVIKVIAVTVIKRPVIAKHHICFGKTDGIGWYEVSRDGGNTFEIVFGNATIEVDEGTVLIIRVGDIIGDDFTFYVNGKKVEKDAADCIAVTVEGYMLIGALSMDVDVPDVEESLSLLQKIINAIKAFFEWLFGII